MQNYKNADSIKTIPHEEFKRLIYEENYGKKIHRNKKVSNFEAGEIITLFFKHNKFASFLGNIIVSFYKNSKKEIQSIWSTDVARKTFVINEENRWVIDKSGVKVSEVIVNPLLNYVDKLLVMYMQDIYIILNKSNYSESKYVDELKYSTELRSNLYSKKICDKIILDITPKLFLDKYYL